MNVLFPLEKTPLETAPRSEPEPATHALEARVVELEALLAAERERSARRQRLLSLAEELARLRDSSPAQRPHRAPATELPAQPAAAVQVDAYLDTGWAHSHEAFSRCIQVFHQEWSGIRAAAGFLPGRKLALTADRPLTPYEHRRAVELCAQVSPRAILFHGHSRNSSELMQLLRRTLGPGVRLLAVWHGSTTQFHFPAEREGFSELLRLRREGVLDGVACVKPQMYALSELIFPLTLLNLPPRVAPRPRPAAPTRAALLPLPNNWWKNFHTNLVVAANSPALSCVYTTTPVEQCEALPLRNAVVNVGRLERAALFQLIPQVDVLLNVTLTECQPMSALESLAFGVPCLTGPLSLGELDSHPYQRLVQVPGTGSLLDISQALSRTLELRTRSPLELEDMLGDYSRRLVSEALRRYQEFIHP